ncbi:unnamed protein product [Somion occarium]|uniref:F-box domain-containing protein n=1 Tax=Somion occarium TaxID=3059160 RepID=A0ABP1DQH9_9APHY
MSSTIWHRLHVFPRLSGTRLNQSSIATSISMDAQFSLLLPEDDLKEDNKKKLKSPQFWKMLSRALTCMDGVREVGLECPFHPDLLAALLSPMDHLTTLSLICVDDYSKCVSSTDDSTGTFGILPDLKAKLPSLRHLEIQVQFFVDPVIRDIFHGMVADHAEQLQGLSLYIRTTKDNEFTGLLPEDICLPNLRILADLPLPYLTPALPRQIPNITTLTFASIPFGPIPTLSLSHAFPTLEKIETSYTVMPLFSTSPRSLQSIEIHPGMDTHWEDVRVAVKSLINCAPSLRILHLDLFMLGAPLNELWTLMPPLSSLESIFFRVAPDWSSFDLRYALEILVSVSEDLFPRLPNLRTFTFLEGCPTFPLSSFNEFATLKVQRHMLDHWEQVGLPGSLSEVSFTSSVKWSKRGRDWVPRSAVGEFKQWEIGIQPAVASIRID